MAITVTKTLTAAETSASALPPIYHFTLDATYTDTTSAWVKIQGLPPNKVMRLLRYDVVTSVNNQVGFYNNDTTASQATEIHKAGSLTTRNQAPSVSGALLDSGMWFRSDSNGCIYCQPSLASGGDISRLEGFISVQ